MDDNLKMNYNETDEDKSQKEFESKVDKIIHGRSNDQKIKEALKLIDGLLESPHAKRVMVTPEVSLPDILEKLKETLENN